MKPFNLEKALAGEKIVTRDGREVTQLTRFSVLGNYPLYAVVNGSLYSFDIDGRWSTGQELTYDLFMAEHERAILISQQIKRIEGNIKRAEYTQNESVVTRSTYLNGNGFEAIEIPESLFRIIGKLIISEYQQELMKLKNEFETL